MVPGLREDIVQPSVSTHDFYMLANYKQIDNNNFFKLIIIIIIIDLRKVTEKHITRSFDSREEREREREFCSVYSIDNNGKG